MSKNFNALEELSKYLDQIKRLERDNEKLKKALNKTSLATLPYRLPRLKPVTKTAQKGRMSLLGNKLIYDTEVVPAGVVQQNFFCTVVGKDRGRANFRGDETLVQERNIFLPRFVRMRSIDPVPERSRKNLCSSVLEIRRYNYGKIFSERERVQDILYEPERDVATNAFGKIFELPEAQVIWGGRSIQVALIFSSLLEKDLELMVEIEGGEYEPAS